MTVLAYLALAISGPAVWLVLLWISDAIELWTRKGKVIFARDRTPHDRQRRPSDGEAIR